MDSVFAPQGYEKFAGFDRARIGTHALDHGLCFSTLYFGTCELCNLAQGKSIHDISNRKKNSGKHRLPACPIRQPAEQKPSATPQFRIACLRQPAANGRQAARAP
ncbi:MAG: hypothetical protein DME44_07840 [Verrucomicrobia bacterium]|nr:MAG: hypothetical protein DME44_07840 [Verrucomicrobiota bacterium]